MASQIETVILKLKGLGFFEFILPFLFTAAIFYGLLRKSKVMGDPKENIAVNAVIALVAGFMVWAYPILAGVQIENLLSQFFFKGTIIILSILIGVLVAGMFLPADLPGYIGQTLKGGRSTGVFLMGGILVTLIIAVSVGIDKILFPNWTGFGFGGGVGMQLDSETILSVVVILGMAGAVIAMAWGGGKGK